MAITFTIPSDEDLRERVKKIDEEALSSSILPPSVLIIRRRAIRAYPDGSLVVEYYSDALGQTIAIPINPTGLPVL